jgi:hypothetical protein
VIDYQEADRDRAVRDVLAVIRHPLAVASRLDRETAYELAKHFSITATDLLDAAAARMRRNS